MIIITKGKEMKKILLLSIVGATTVLNAQAIPGVNSKAGAMIVPEGKLVAGIKYIYLKRDSMFDGSDEVQNRQKLDAKANGGESWILVLIS